MRFFFSDVGWLERLTWVSRFPGDKRQNSCPEEGAEESDAKTDCLMGSWLELIEKKNELFRRENELHYRIRQRELEERHADIEYELRQLLAKQGEAAAVFSSLFLPRPALKSDAFSLEFTAGSLYVLSQARGNRIAALFNR